MGIGGLWVPADQRDRLKFALNRAAETTDLNAELKWSKVSVQRLAGYKAFLDVFAQFPDVLFRIIVVDQTKLNLSAFHQGDRELGFYKFYYEMLIKWLQPQTEYVILLDHRDNSLRGRCTDLRRVLQRKAPELTFIRQLALEDSQASRIAQLVDLLTGATTAAWCKPSATGPKSDLQRHIAGLVGRRRLDSPSLSPAPEKFNVFQIRLQDVPPDSQGR